MIDGGSRARVDVAIASVRAGTTDLRYAATARKTTNTPPLNHASEAATDRAVRAVSKAVVFDEVAPLQSGRCGSALEVGDLFVGDRLRMGVDPFDDEVCETVEVFLCHREVLA